MAQTKRPTAAARTRRDAYAVSEPEPPRTRPKKQNAGKARAAAEPAYRKPAVSAEDEARGTSPVMLLLWEIVLFFLALLMGYLIIIPQQSGTMQSTIRSLFYGLGGVTAPVFPLFALWLIAVLNRRRKNTQKPLSVTVSDGLLFLCAPACVHIFCAKEISEKEMLYVRSWANFIYKSFSCRKGGGGIGAFFTWHLYSLLGTWGGFLVLLGVVTVLLAISGRLTRAGEKLTVLLGGLGEAAHDANAVRLEHRNQRAERKRERELARAAESDYLINDPEPESGYLTEDPVPEAEPVSEGCYRGVPGKRKPAPKPAARTELPAEEAPKPRTKRRARMSMPELEEIEDTRESISYGDGLDGIGMDMQEKADAAGRRRSAKNTRPSAAVESLTEGRRKPRHAAEESDYEDIAAELAKPLAPARKTRRGEEYDPFRLLPDEEAAEWTAESASDPEPKPETKDEWDEPAPEPAPEIEDVPWDDEPAPEPAPEIEDVPWDDEPEPDSEPEPEPEPMPEPEPEPEQEPLGLELFEEPEPPKRELPKLKRPEMVAENLNEEQYNYPPIDLLEHGTEVREDNTDYDEDRARELMDTLRDFGIESRLVGIAHGPAVTRFELVPKAGIRVNRIAQLADDIKMRLAATSVRIEAPIPGKTAVGVEVPNEKVEVVHLRDVLMSKEATKHPSRIAVGLGKDNSGHYNIADIAKMPHVLIAGQTGSGKSVCINSIIASILFRATPDEVRLILVDPKVVELSVYNGIPHLVCPVVTDPKKAASALNWAVSEMTNRYKIFAERGVRDIKGYNKALEEGEKIMPQMVIIIDELADLMMACPGEVEDSIQRLAQLARACGIHLVIATQRPSVNVITGVIKANIPTRIAFSVASQVDSRTMIDHAGAENLIGNGDMLYVPSGGIAKAHRVQGAWVSDEEVHSVVQFIKANSEATYDEDMIEQMDKSVRSDAEQEEAVSEYDPRLPEAVEIVVQAGQASVSMLQRKMRVGYARAGRLIDEMEKRGIVSPNDGAKPREVMITREQLSEMFEDGVA